MKTVIKGFGVGIVLAFIGLLVFGAINRTMAKSEDVVLENESAHVETGEEFVIINEPETEVVEAGRRPMSTPVVSLDSSPLTQDEADALLYMREEEKLASDVYLTLSEIWGLPAFANIASSEQTHMDSVLTLIVRYGLEDPAQAERGVFTDPELQELYTSLVTQGSLSAEEAFKVGAAIEEIDILDLQTRLMLTSHSDIQQVFDSLKSGSANHLGAFVGNLSSRYGITYTPQYLDDETYQGILADGGTTGFQGTGGGTRRGGQH